MGGLFYDGVWGVENIASQVVPGLFHLGIPCLPIAPYPLYSCMLRLAPCCVSLFAFYV